MYTVNIQHFAPSRIHKSNIVRRTMTMRRYPPPSESSNEDQAEQQYFRTKEGNMTIVLICIVIMFIACQSLKIIPDIYEAIICQHSENTACDSTTTIEVLISVSHLLLAINSASNFVICMFRGQDFRGLFWRIFILGQWTRESRREAQVANAMNMTPKVSR